MKLNRILALFMILGIAFSSLFMFQRNTAENAYKNVEITLDYGELLRMSNESDKDVDYYLKGFKEAGASSVSINEATLDSLKLHPGYDVETKLRGYDLEVKCDEKIYPFIKKGFEAKLGKTREIEELGDNTLRIQGKTMDYIFDETKVKDFSTQDMGAKRIGEGSRLEFLGLGFLEEDILEAKKAGLEVILRPFYQKDYEDASKSSKRYFSYIDKYDLKPSTIIFAGKESLSWNDKQDQFAKELMKRNIAVGMVETSVQREHLEVKGVDQLVDKMDYKATRVFNIWNYIQKRFDYQMPMHHNGEEIVNTLFRAVTERNIRVIYFKPFLTLDGRYVTDLEVYKARFADFEKRIGGAHGMKLGPVQTMPYRDPNRFLLIPVAIGVLAAALIVLDNLLKISYKNILAMFGIGILGIAGIYGAGIKVDLMNKMMALGATIIMPTMSIIILCATIKEIEKLRKEKTQRATFFEAFFRGLTVLVLCCIISLFGVFFEVSFLGHSKFLLEMDIFKGVKLSQLAPLMAAVLVYMVYFGYKREDDSIGLKFEEIKTLLTDNVKIWQVVLVGIIGIAGIIFIARTGHETDIKPSELELLFRNMLEMILVARPRTKAFLIAHPALIMMVFMAFKGRGKIFYLPLLLAATLGQGNIVNTFSHIRAPLYLSYARTLYEIVFGAFVGLFMLGVLVGVEKLIKRIRNV